MSRDADTPRLGVAAAIAPLSIPLLILFVIVVFTDDSISGLNSLVLIWATIFSYISCLVLGLPITHLLKKYDLLTVTALCVSGFAAGMIVTFLFSAFLGATVGIVGVENVQLEGVILFGIGGAIVATVFGLVARIRLY